MPIDMLTAFMEKGVPRAIPVSASGDAPPPEPRIESEPGEEEQV